MKWESLANRLIMFSVINGLNQIHISCIYNVCVQIFYVIHTPGVWMTFLAFIPKFLWQRTYCAVLEPMQCTVLSFTSLVLKDFTNSVKTVLKTDQTKWDVQASWPCWPCEMLLLGAWLPREQSHLQTWCFYAVSLAVGVID